ncbi:MAG: isopeptide-forming domain-containing fimbrial protein [Ruminococcus sp.]|nr:isopeptide-forming domain-containing fimbrial protein [Ruminococcus sp.]
MKKMRRIAAIAAATVMAASMASISAFADGAYTVTINNSTAGHTYEAYQIFAGTITEDADNNLVLTSATWGSGVVENNLVAETVAKQLNDDGMADFIDSLELSNVHLDSEWNDVNQNYTISGLTDGYYLIKDKDGSLANKDDAYTYTMVKVVGSNITITPKSAKPTLDKQVYDNDDGAASGDNNGWGETADHAFNESFQFKLTATIPDDEDLDKYDTYKLVFTDTLGAGVVFDGFESVKIGGTDTNIVYTTDAVTGDTAKTWTLTIEDLKGQIDDIKGKTVEVIYNAHLDETASTYHVSTINSGYSKNSAKLSYSNNPNWEGEGTEQPMGETPEDSVYIYSYRIMLRKTDADGAALTGVGFRLYDSEGQNEIPLIYDATAGFYRPIETGEQGEEMKSSGTYGEFNIGGLDAGTYTLKETSPLSGYTPAKDTKITISSSHNEGTDELPKITLQMTDNGSITIINNKGTTLPETGGIGTKIFTVAGGTIVVGAGVLLITKKRMKKED